MKYLVRYKSSRCYLYFYCFQFGFPCFVSEFKLEDARRFEGPKRDIRRWINENLGTRSKYEIVEDKQ